MAIKALVETLVRAVIAAIVLTITGYLTWDRAPIAQEWQAVFVMVVAYYFTDRPQADRLRMGDTRGSEPAVRLELVSQFTLALLLMIATVVFFTVRNPTFPNAPLPNEVAGAWLGGVTVAIAFYFKPNESTDAKSSDEHDLLRAALAIGAGISTMVIFGLRRGASLDPKMKVDALPLQWVALAFIVIAFYFKQRDARVVHPLSAPEAQ